jgi:Replication-relaxation
MELSGRDIAVLRLANQYKQIAPSHLAAAVFADVSATPLDRCLHRLVEHQYLVRIGRRASSFKGGAGGFVYQLGPRGWWYLKRPGQYFKRAVSEHALKVADAFVELLEGRAAGKLDILHLATEYPVGDAVADMYVELGVYNPRRKLSFFLEIDLGTERVKRIEAKLDAYLKAYRASELEIFPYIVFVVPDDWREHEINRIIKNHAGKELFSVCLFGKTVDKLLSFE